MTGLRVIGGVILCGCLVWARPASADAVGHWNSVASGAILTAGAAGRPGPAQTLDFAMVHAAVHDAVQAIVKRHEPYHQDTAARAQGRRVARWAFKHYLRPLH